MKKLVILGICGYLLGAYIAGMLYKSLDDIQVNQDMVDRCTEYLQENPNGVCD